MKAKEVKTERGYVLLEGGREYPEIIERRSVDGKTYAMGGGKEVYLASAAPRHYKENGLSSDGPFLDIDLSNPDNIKTFYRLERLANGIGYKFQSREPGSPEIVVKMLDYPKQGQALEAKQERETLQYPGIDAGLDVYVQATPTRYGIYKVIHSDSSPRVFHFEVGWSKPPIDIEIADEKKVAGAELQDRLSNGIDGVKKLTFDNCWIPECKAWDVYGRSVEVCRSIKGNVLTEEVIIPEESFIEDEEGNLVAYDPYPITLDVDTELKEESGTWEAPENVKSPITVECWGGGGAGGGGGTEGRGGGGGGAYVRASVDVIAGNEYSYTVGVGGLGYTFGTGGAGGDTQWGDGIIVKATGGAGGTSSAGGAGGAAVDCNGEIKYSGGTGGSRANNVAGGGGSGAGSTGNGNDGGNRSGGAAVPEYGGKGGDGARSGGSGEPGENYGGGGGGGRKSLSGGTGRGGNGAPGLIRLTYEVITTVYVDLPGLLQVGHRTQADMKRLRNINGLEQLHANSIAGEIKRMRTIAGEEIKLYSETRGNITGVTVSLTGEFRIASSLLGRIIASTNLAGIMKSASLTLADMSRIRRLLGESIAAITTTGNIGRIRGFSGSASMAAVMTADLSVALRLPKGHRIWPPLFIQGKAATSEISWVATVPPGTSLTVDTGLSAHPDIFPTEWQQATDSGAIPVLPPGADMNGKFLWVRINFVTTVPDQTPRLYSLAVGINGKLSTIDIREGTWEYLRDYDLGDIVTARYPGIVTMDARIIEVVEEYTAEEGAKHRVVLGREWPDLISTTKAGRKNIDPEVRR